MAENESQAHPQEAELRNALHRRLVSLYHDIKDATKGAYKPHGLRSIVSEHGGVQAACRLILSEEGTPGFWELMQRELPELTVEYIVLTGPWREIMPLPVLVIARERLKDVAGINLPPGLTE